MRRFTIIIFTGVFLALSGCARNETGEALKGLWQGNLRYPGLELRIVFKFTMSPDGTLNAIILRPDESTDEIPADKVYITHNEIFLEMGSIDCSFEGHLLDNGQIIKGEWRQGQHSQSLVLKSVTQIAMPDRPQLPVPPYPYSQEDVTFVNANARNVQIAGTLTMPETEGSHPAVILIPGVGAHDRDYTIMGHKPFLVIADHLTRRGIAVLRYDERGIGGSTGEGTQATSLDYAMDVLAGVKYLRDQREIDASHIGLIGHSEGGTIATLAALESPDIAFIVMMASPGIPGIEYNYQYEESMGRAMGLSEEAIAARRKFQKEIFRILLQNTGQEVKRDQLYRLFEDMDPAMPQTRKHAAIERFLSPWFRFNLMHDPIRTLAQIQCPVLALFGEKDMQVPPNRNAQAIQHLLEEREGRDSSRVKAFPGLNHFFQTAQSGAPTEYGQIEETIAPVVLEFISDWVLERISIGDQY